MRITRSRYEIIVKGAVRDCDVIRACDVIRKAVPRTLCYALEKRCKVRICRVALVVVAFGPLSQAQAPARAPAPAPARGAAASSQAQVSATLAQLMKGILYPSSNVIFAAQDQNPADVPPAKDPSTATNPLASSYGKWEA